MQRQIVSFAVAIVVAVLSVPFSVDSASAYSSGDIPICSQNNIPPKDKTDQMLSSMNLTPESDGYVLTREGTGFYNLVITQSPLDNPIMFGSTSLFTSGSSTYRNVFELPSYSVNTAWQSFNSQTLPLNSPDCVVLKSSNLGVESDGSSVNFNSLPTYTQRYTTVTCDQNLQDYDDVNNVCVDRTCANQFDPTYTGTYPECSPPVDPNTDPPATGSSDPLRFGHKIGIIISVLWGAYIIWILRFRSVTT